MPYPLFAEIRFPDPVTVPPIVFAAEPRIKRPAPFGAAVVPAGSVPKFILLDHGAGPAPEDDSRTRESRDHEPSNHAATTGKNQPVRASACLGAVELDQKRA